jgi:putative FmdB family regulatory protein
MPLYVYKCDDCGKKVEILQAFDDPHPKCSTCSTQMKKQVALTSFTLKGGGWAKDNYGLKSE